MVSASGSVVDSKDSNILIDPISAYGSWWSFIKGLVVGAIGVLVCQIIIIYRLYTFLFVEKRWIKPSLGTKPKWISEFQEHENENDHSSSNLSNTDKNADASPKKKSTVIIESTNEHKEAWPVNIVEHLRINLTPQVNSDGTSSDFGPTEPCHWFDLIIKRYFIALRQSQFFKEKIKTKWNDKINLKIKGNAFISSCRVTDFAFGQNAPDIKGVRILKRFKEDASVTCDFDLEYKGGASIAIEAQLPGGIKLPVRVHVGSMKGKVRMRTPSIPFNDMVAISFVENPGVNFTVDSPITIASSEYLRGMVNKLISNAIRKIFLEMWILPTWRAFFLPLMEPKLDDVSKRQSALRQFNQNSNSSASSFDGLSNTDSVIKNESYQTFNASVNSFPESVVNSHNVGSRRAPSVESQKRGKLASAGPSSKKALLKAVNIWDTAKTTTTNRIMGKTGAKPSVIAQDCLLSQAFPVGLRINPGISELELEELDEMFVKSIVSLMEVKQGLNDSNPLLGSNDDLLQNDNDIIPSYTNNNINNNSEGPNEIDFDSSQSALSEFSIKNNLNSDWKLIRQKHGIKLHKKKEIHSLSNLIDDQSSTSSTVEAHITTVVTRAEFIIKCDAERVFNVVSNTEHFRHVEENYTGSDLIHQFDENREIIKLRYAFNNIVNINNTSQNRTGEKLLSCLQIKRKLRINEVGLDHNSYIVAFRDASILTNSNDSLSITDDSSVDKNIVYIFAYHIVPLETDPLNSCKIVILSQFCHHLTKLEVSLDYCRKLKSFVEELANLNIGLPSTKNTNNDSVRDDDSIYSKSDSSSINSKKVNKIKNALTGLSSSFIKRKDKTTLSTSSNSPTPFSPSQSKNSILNQERGSLQSKMNAIINGHSNSPSPQNNNSNDLANSPDSNSSSASILPSGELTGSTSVSQSVSAAISRKSTLHSHEINESEAPPLPIRTHLPERIVPQLPPRDDEDADTFTSPLSAKSLNPIDDLLLETEFSKIHQISSNEISPSSKISSEKPLNLIDNSPNVLDNGEHGNDELVAALASPSSVNLIDVESNPWTNASNASTLASNTIALSSSSTIISPKVVDLIDIGDSKIIESKVDYKETESYRLSSISMVSAQEEPLITQIIEPFVPDINSKEEPKLIDVDSSNYIIPQEVQYPIPPPKSPSVRSRSTSVSKQNVNNNYNPFTSNSASPDRNTIKSVEEDFSSPKLPPRQFVRGRPSHNAGNSISSTKSSLKSTNSSPSNSPKLSQK